MVANDEELKLFDEAMNAFKDIDGEDYYPQIYIPYYEEIVSQSNGRIMVSDPTVIIYTGNETQTVYTGYQLDAAGELKAISTPVDEIYAQNNETWIVSINESSASQCQIEQMIENNSTASRLVGLCGGGTGGGGGTTTQLDAYIKHIKIKCHKESWVAGASEVHIITRFTNNGSQDPGEDFAVNYYEGGQYKGGRIYKMRRNDVKQENWKRVDFNILSNWETVFPDLYFAHTVIFEFDAWPTANNDARWNNNMIEKYRSADIYYDLKKYNRNNFSSINEINGCIEWIGENR